MAQLRYMVLSIASAFLVLQLSEQVAASLGIVSFYLPPYIPSVCFGYDPGQLPQDRLFAAAGDHPVVNIWKNGRNCGKFFKIRCRHGCKSTVPIRVKIVDHCRNNCAGGRAFALSLPAYFKIAAPDAAGRMYVEYSLDEKDAETFIAEVGHIGQ